MNAFLLRFQEKANQIILTKKNQDDIPNIGTGTETITRVKKESADPEPAYQGVALPRHIVTKLQSIGLGTQTKTEIKAESPDSDPYQSQLSIIPRCF